MLATVVALINKAGPITPLLYGRRTEEMLGRRVAVLMAAAGMVVLLLALGGKP